MKACGGINNMPSQDQLTQLAKYVYGTDSINSSGFTDNLVLDTTKASQFLSVSPGSSSGWFYVWSGQEYRSGYAYDRTFSSTGTGWYGSGRNYSPNLAVCLDH